MAPLPMPQPHDAGPARLQYQGQDFVLRARSIVLGRHTDCDLVFDRARYPHVSPHHCEIVYDPSVYVLRDLSREGTWVNDRPVSDPVQLRPGDWIRLGPGGPVLRFLGQPDPATREPWTVNSGPWAVGR
jgi:pSer/pThr/pTyr-binding forkhead associated (FHA) protein